MGNVAFLAARLVGPAGSVIGIDSDPAQVAFAEQRAKAEGRATCASWRPIFVTSSLIRRWTPSSAVSCSCMRPIRSTRCVARCAISRVDGVIALQESIIDYDGPVFIEPPGCLAAKAVEWFRAGFKHAGVQPRMGMRLFGVMRAAGLDPSPDIDMLVPIQQGPQGALFRCLTAVVRSQIPAIVASGAATLAEIDIDTLEQRLIADAPPGGVVGYFNSGHVGVWARTECPKLSIKEWRVAISKWRLSAAGRPGLPRGVGCTTRTSIVSSSKRVRGSAAAHGPCATVRNFQSMSGAAGCIRPIAIPGRRSRRRKAARSTRRRRPGGAFRCRWAFRCRNRRASSRRSKPSMSGSARCRRQRRTFRPQHFSIRRVAGTS